MRVQEFMEHMEGFLNFGALYYTIQLVRCALMSAAVFAVVFLLRKTLLKNRVFLKGALWSLFLPILFVGKMKFFYESRIGAVLFTCWTGIFTRHMWLNWLYFGVMFLCFARRLFKRRKLKKLIDGMEQRQIEGTLVYVTRLPVTPFTAGVFRPKNRGAADHIGTVRERGAAGDSSARKRAYSSGAFSVLFYVGYSPGAVMDKSAACHRGQTAP